VVDENESPRQGCIREVKEEMGLDIDIKRFLCVSYRKYCSFTKHCSKIEKVLKSKGKNSKEGGDKNG